VLREQHDERVRAALEATIARVDHHEVRGAAVELRGKAAIADNFGHDDHGVIAAQRGSQPAE
jgi:hypothetical protein